MYLCIRIGAHGDENATAHNTENTLKTTDKLTRGRRFLDDRLAYNSTNESGRGVRREGPIPQHKTQREWSRIL